MAYLYRHIRLDKNVPFYIGIGSDSRYSRAFQKKYRSPFWKAITQKTEYEVEILIDDISWEEACKKEIEFIELYKRYKDGGTLCNITKGGDGKLGVAPSNAYVKGSVPHSKGKPMPLHVKQCLIDANRGRPTWNKGRSPSPETVQKQLATKKERGVLSGIAHPNFGKKMPLHVKTRLAEANKDRAPWNKGISTDVPHLKKMNQAKRVSVLQMNGSVVIGEYESMDLAEKITGINKGNISLCVMGKRPSAGGYKWAIKK